MPKRVLDVGNCVPDHQAIRATIERQFDAHVERKHSWDDTLKALREGGVDLVLVNRKLDCDYSDGIEIIHRMQADGELAGIPVMLVSNLAEHQQTAIAAGAAPGFGKAELAAETTRQRLAAVLEESAL